MAADVLAFIKEHGLKTPTLIGHSMFVYRTLPVTVRNPNLLTGPKFVGAQRRP